MKKVFNLIVVDESGSMSVIRDQALAGINETLATIKTVQDQSADEMEQRVSLLLFDSGHCNFIYHDKNINNCRQLSFDEYRPGGATPLYDAIGLGISKVNAVTAADDNVLVTIITDGMENCSREYTLSMIKNLIEKLKKQNWTFTLIGTDDLNVEGMAQDMGFRDSMRFCKDVEGTKRMFEREHRARGKFYACLRAGKVAPPEGFFFDEDEHEEEESKRKH